ncbi:hypothetical protein OBBRIDRAFT_739934, partial [Obba rivulosa]
MLPWPEHALRHGIDEARFVLLERFADDVFILDKYFALWLAVPVPLLLNERFNLVSWWIRQSGHARTWPPEEYLGGWNDNSTNPDDNLGDSGSDRTLPAVELNAVATRERQAERDNLSALQRNAARPQDFKRKIPEPAVVVVEINGYPARALLDSGSLADFMSSKLAHQLGIKTFELEKPLPVHLAVQGSRAKINVGCSAEIKYQAIKESRYFDIVNLLNYDLILGTPFWFQHQISVRLNPTAVAVGSPIGLPIEGQQVRVLESRAADMFENEMERARLHIREYAAPICVSTSDTPLPPLRVINHTIPLIDEKKVYHWRPSKCPDALRSAWNEKRDAYIKTGRWQISNARNTSPMLLLTKPGTG